MHTCPNCGFEPVDGLGTCPNCGYSLANKNDETKEFKLKNDEIEWSELVEMPIETVEEIFTEEQQTAEEKAAEDQEETSTAEAITENTDKLIENNEKTEDEDLTIVEKKPEYIEEEIEETNPILAQYLQAHREEDEINLSAKDEISPVSAIIEDDQISEEETPLEKNSQEKAEPIKPSLEAWQTQNNSAPEFTEADSVENEESSTEANQSETPEEEVEDFAGLETETVRALRSRPKKNYRKFTIGLAAVAVLGIAGGTYYYQQQQAAEARQTAAAEKATDALDEVAAEIAAFYTSDKQIFIKADKVNSNTAKLAQTLAQYKDHRRYQALENDLAVLNQKQTAIQEVNALFTDTAINGSKLSDSLELKEDQEITVTVNTDDGKFNQLLNQAIQQGKSQYDQIAKAKDEVSALITDGEVPESVTREAYDAANQIVTEVVNQDLVTAEIEELKTIDQVLTDRETAAKEAEEQAAEETAAESASQNESSTTTNSANQPILATNETQVADSSNSAWQWGSGVESEFIQTCIDRGYIVAGGYRLERAQIQNGEGYYNLYATNNQSRLTSGVADSGLPMYIVTVNCKTGWFQGNGGN